MTEYPLNDFGLIDIAAWCAAAAPRILPELSECGQGWNDILHRFLLRTAVLLDEYPRGIVVLEDVKEKYGELSILFSTTGLPLEAEARLQEFAALAVAASRVTDPGSGSLSPDSRHYSVTIGLHGSPAATWNYDADWDRLIRGDGRVLDAPLPSRGFEARQASARDPKEAAILAEFHASRGVLC